MTLVNFLKGAVKASAEMLVKVFVKEVAKATNLTDALVAKAIAAITVLRGLQMEEEIKLLRLLVIAECGRMGVAAPIAITQLYAQADSKPAATMVPATPQTAPTALTSKPTLVPANQTTTQATAPARELQPAEKPFNLDAGYRKWVGQLKSLVDGKNVPWPSLQGLTAKLANADFRFGDDDFRLLFSAMKVAQAKGQHILNNKANPAKLFQAAPLESLDDLLFAPDGLLLAVTGEVSGFQGTMPPWLCAKVSIVLEAVMAADYNSRLGKQDVEIVDSLISAVEDRNPPNWLREKGQDIFSTESASPSATKSGGLMAEKITAALAR